jgi:predicted RNA methylase
LIFLRRLLLLLALAPLSVWGQTQTWGWDDGTVPYVQTPMEIVERMMRMAEVGKGDHLIDLGSGDGRIVIEAAKRGATGLGVDLDGSLVKLATENAAKAGVGDKAQFRVMDLFDADLSSATVVTFYLLPDFNAKLLPRLLKLKPGTRIVSHAFDMGDWVPEQTIQVMGKNVYFWTIPKR